MVSATNSDPDATAVLARFVRELREVRELYGNPGVAAMAKRIQTVKGAAGSKNVFLRMVREIDAPPQPEILRGFVLGLGAPPAVADDWERRRKDLVVELQSLRDDDRRAAPKQARGTRTMSRSTVLTARVGVSLVVAAATGAVAGIMVSGAPAPEPTAADPAGQVAFTAPTAHQIVTAGGFVVSGTAPGIPAQDQLWLVTIADPRTKGDTYQPQDVPCVIGPGDGFACRNAFVGGPADAGRSYDVILVTVSPTAAETFIAYNESNPSAHGYPGLPKLPDGAHPLARVEVTRG